jgi:hypothetical protein
MILDGVGTVYVGVLPLARVRYTLAPTPPDEGQCLRGRLRALDAEKRASVFGLIWRNAPALILEDGTRFFFRVRHSRMDPDGDSYTEIETTGEPQPAEPEEGDRG